MGKKKLDDKYADAGERWQQEISTDLLLET